MKAGAEAPGLRLFTVFDIPVRVDPSWFLVLILITWSLATGWFPMRGSDVGPAGLWIMGLIGALGLFASIVVHEYSHSLVARREGVAIRGITLFLFGGVAEMEGEPPSPGAEARIAIAGPVASVLLGAIAGLGTWLFVWLGGRSAALVVEYLAVINVVLAVFNLVPAFPLDGGRLYRAWLWHRGGDAMTATRKAVQTGSTFGAVLIGLGLFRAVLGDLLGGLWLLFIGIFIRRAAAGSLAQTQIQHRLHGAPVRQFAETRVVVVDPGLTIQQLVDNFFLRHHYEMFPVVRDGELLGSITIVEVGSLPRSEWASTTVGEAMVPASKADLVHEDDDASDALNRMARSGKARLMVVSSDGRLSGILTVKDLLEFIRVGMEIGAPPQSDVR